MRAVAAICLKELRRYFTSPVAWALAFIFLLLFGYLSFSAISQFSLHCMQLAAFAELRAQLNLNRMVVEPLLYDLSFILLFLAPLITMRLFAEERRLRTDELLFTLPLRPWQIVGGKFLGALGFLGFLVACTLPLPLSLLVVGNPDPGPLCTGYLGAMLVGASFLAVGLLFSALTENQIVAAAMTFGALLLLWVVDWAAQAAEGSLREVLRYLSLMGHLQGLLRGLVESQDLVFYLSLIVLFLFATERVLECERWR